MSLPTRALALGIDEPFPAALRGSAVSIGNFDGVHLGHIALISELRRVADQERAQTVVVTFDPHPLRLLAPDRFMPQLTTPEERAELLLRAGADWVVILKTTQELLQLEADEFLRRLLLNGLAAKAVVEGFNFHFGKDRQGTPQSLQTWCNNHDMACHIVAAKLGSNNEPISSSRVRAALDAGDVVGAARLLGRPYRLQGRVITGDRRGKELGFPTANLGDIRTVIPGDSVYAVSVKCDFGTFTGAANFGPNPTFGVTARKVEVHLLDFDGDLYDQEIEIEFAEQLRQTRKFASKDELVRQLTLDIERARASAARTVEDKTPNLKQRVEAVLREQVAPALFLDGAGFEVLDVTDGVVRMRMTGACMSCPSTIMTLIMGIEQELRKHIPEIEYLEAVP
jgi:riboflavin kinase/FMN adenylyltransferase